MRLGRSRGARFGVLGALVAVGCAPETTPLFREDFSRMRTDLTRIEQTIQRAQAEVKADLQRGDRQSAQTLTELQRSVAQLGVRLDELGRETAQIQGRLDEVRRRLDHITLQLDVVGGPAGPRPLAPAGAAPSPPLPRPDPTQAGPQLQPAGPPPIAPPTGARAPTGPPPASPAAPRTPASEAVDLYQTAYIDYTRGNYNLAIAAFTEFIRRYPKTDLAEKAQYWIGESHFSLARSLQVRGEADRATQAFERAVQEFRRILIDYPQGESVPSALYKRALALIELKQPALAEADLRYLIDQYPTREEAAKAKDELARLRHR